MDLVEYLKTSYTAYQATQNGVKMLEENGFTRLNRGEKWNLKAGGKYYLTVNDSAFFAFKFQDLTKGLSVACAHTDSPCLKIKGDSLSNSVQGKRLNVEVYGGLLNYSFLDIPLKIAGRVFVKTQMGVECKLVVSEFNVVIPSQCIHHTRDANDGLKLSVQNDLQPLFLADDLYKALGLENVLDADLYVTPAVTPFVSGVNGELLSSPRIDNLTSVYACICGLSLAEPKGLSVIACFDNEEIGSGTKQGAGSRMLEEIIKEIYRDQGLEEMVMNKAINNGLLLSIDNGHATHPAHPEKGDPLNVVKLNGGVVVKHHVNYSTDGRSSALLKSILIDNEIPYQDYYNHSDIRCGSTLGLISSRQLAIDAVDIGLAQLAMHSAVETAGVKDVEYMTKCVQAVLSSTF